VSAFLGVDGGGSGSRLRWCGEAPIVHTVRTSGPLNLTTLSPREWRATLDQLLDGLPEPTAATFCIAGMRSTSSRAALVEHVRSWFPTAPVRAEPDFVAALGCFDQPVAACVVAGTGSIVCSRDHAGDVVTSGGEGPGAGDRGSAFRLGERALARGWTAPARPSADGRDRSTVEVAALAPLLTHAADAGDRLAGREVADEMTQLARLTRAHLRRDAVGGSCRVGLVGSVWKSHAARTAFWRALDRILPGVDVVPAVRRPVDAAVALAREAHA
jgi:N-acetylglucosamine kinase-like BadF-type ATPase